MSKEFHDPFDALSDEEFDEETAQLFDEPQTTVQLTIPTTLYDEIKALAEQRAGEHAHQLMVYALNLGIRQIQAGEQ